MQSRFLRHSSFVLAILVTLSLFAIDAEAQKRRRRRVSRTSRPVVTNPAIAPSGSEQNPDGDERIISTADADPNESESTGAATARRPKGAARPATAREMERTIDSLSTQVNKLTEKIGQLQENDQTHLDMERLTRAEQRGESLRTQLVDVESKLADLQPKLDQIEYGLKPENIERAAAGFGTVRPEELRETRRRQLENERARVQAQIKILEASRTRLEAAVITADAEVDRLRRRLETRELQGQATPATGETRVPDNPTPPQ